MWAYDRKTILRWHELAINHCPGYAEGFRKIMYIGTCPECNKDFELSPLQYKSARRKDLVSCPHCKQENVPDEPKSVETHDTSLKIPGTYAKVLRLVGFLIAVLGKEKTIAALTTDPEHKKLRARIRKELIQKRKCKPS